jgi:hypothetical protein
MAAAAAAFAAAASASSDLPGFVGCRAYVSTHPRLVIRPASIIAACADANFYFTGLRWSRWSDSSASGAGRAHQNDCTPYCAAGHFHVYAASVTLSAPKTCASSRREFTRLAWTFTRTKPKGVPRSGSETFRCR